MVKKAASAKTKKNSELEFPAIMADILLFNKAEDVKVLDLTGIRQNVCDFFVIAHGVSKNQVQSIAEMLDKEMAKKHAFKPFHREGAANGEWILLDYGFIVAHIFLKEAREFYNLEGLWADAEVKNY